MTDTTQDHDPDFRLRAINACCNRLADVVTEDLDHLYPLSGDEARELADAVLTAARPYA